MGAALTVSRSGEALLTQRLSWIDATRGGCVLAVVLFHVTVWHYLPLAGSDGVADIWDRVNGELAAVRMPMLLLISGFLASRRVRLGWGDRAIVVRVASNYYLYAVWLLIYAAFFVVVGGQSDLPHEITGLGDLVIQLVAPDTPLWFVMALAVYTAVLASVPRAPAWLVLAVLVAASVASGPLGTHSQWAKIPQLFIYFAAGVYGARVLSTFAERVTAGVWLAAAAIAGGLTLLASYTGGPITTALDFLQVWAVMPLGVASFVLAVRLRWVERSLTWIGQRTLSVYVLHALVVIAGVALLAGPAAHALGGALVSNPWLSIAYPLAVTAIVVLACLCLRRLIVTSGLDRWMLELPRGIRERIRA